MKDLSSLVLFSLLLLLLNSCHLDELQFDDRMAKNQGIKPTLVAPVAKGNVTVWDLISAGNKESVNNITKDPNGLVKIIYKEDNLFTYKISELINFPSQNSFSSGDQPIGDISPEDVIINRAIDLQELSGKMNGQLDVIAPLNGQTAPFPAVTSSNMDASFTLSDITDFKTVTLSKGTLTVQLKNKLKVPLSMSGSLYDITNNTEVAPFSFSNLAPATTGSLSFPMAGKELSNKLEFRMHSFDTPGSSAPVAINLSDYMNITFSMTDLAINKGYVKIVRTQTMKGSKGNFEFDFAETDLKAFGAILKKGSLIIKSVSNLPLTGVINFTIPEIKNIITGTPVSATIPLDGSPVSIPLDNTVINFTSDPEKPYNRIPYTYTLTINQSNGFINYSAEDALQMDVTLDHMEFLGVSGDFGKRTIQVDPGQFNLNVELLDKLKGNFKLDNPTLKLTVRNSVGIPGTASLNLQASNSQGQTVALNPPAIDIPVPVGYNDQVVTKDVLITKENSNIVPFISLPPSGNVSYSGKIDFNTSGMVTPQNPNVLSMNAAFGIDMSMEMPMELQVSDLTFRDTSAISGADFKNVETADLIVNAKNGVPLDIDLQLLFVDTITGHQFGATKATRMLSAAKVNTDGSISVVESSHTFSLDQTQMQQLRQANGIVFSGIMSSPNNGATVAPIRSDSRIEMSIVVKSKVNLNLLTHD